ncbi:SH3 domain-containing protein [Ancylobacter oerskovii]|uniref:SH3 domain-containing protein n=1 Tax=Ancylobacter oerskovii TaxID=459519 RepID=A0ABW4YVH1_9HYPH|nr:SH3 domain-containing protein [Ancylobacter oerskovii]MBS7544373.1 SH3 domain-containing protein [Ancylobacter oerskovii]
MKRLLAAAAGLVALTGVASAQTDGFVTTDVNLRAGPGTDYPAVAVLGAGTPLAIFGCLESYSWCDVDWRGYRGWVSARYLEYDYRGRRVELPDYAPMIGVPIIGFSIDNYWGRYYRDRPWYGDRYRWGAPPGRRPPPPPPPGGGWYGGPPPGGGWNNGPPRGGWNGGPPPRGGWNDAPPPRGGWNDGPPPRGGWNDAPPRGGGNGGWNGGGGGWNGGGGGPPPRGNGGPPPQQGRPPQQERPPQQALPPGPPPQMGQRPGPQRQNDGCPDVAMRKGQC